MTPGTRSAPGGTGLAADAGPGYCRICGRFSLLTPEGACANSPSCQQRLTPPEAYDGPHACSLSDLRKPGHPAYRQCSCGQWLHAAEGNYWYRVDRPPRHWLREHGMDPEEFWGMEEAGEPDSPFGAFYSSMTDWRSVIRWLFRHWA